MDEEFELEVEETAEYDASPTGLDCQGSASGCCNSNTA